MLNFTNRKFANNVLLDISASKDDVTTIEDLKNNKGIGSGSLNDSCSRISKGHMKRKNHRIEVNNHKNVWKRSIPDTIRIRSKPRSKVSYRLAYDYEKFVKTLLRLINHMNGEEKETCVNVVLKIIAVYEKDKTRNLMINSHDIIQSLKIERLIKPEKLKISGQRTSILDHIQILEKLCSNILII